MDTSSTRTLNESVKPIPPFTKFLAAVILITAAVLGIRNLTTHQFKWPWVKERNEKTELQAFINQVKQHVVVPTTETPLVATIQDINAVRPLDPFLYREAQNGDRVLRWSNKIVLYSSAQHRVLAVIPMNPTGTVTAATTTISSAAPTATSTTELAEHAVIEVRNGARLPGAGAALADTLKKAGLSVLPPVDAQNKSYRKTIIVKLSAKTLPKTVKLLQSLTKAQLGSLPKEEATGTADFVVIIGSDQKKS